MNMCRHFTPPFYQPTAIQRGFYYRALKTWNNLSAATRNSRSISQFNKKVKRQMELSWILVMIFYISTYFNVTKLLVICFFFNENVIRYI